MMKLVNSIQYVLCVGLAYMLDYCKLSHCSDF